ncbi:MAG: hypothetical protein U0704_02795 [Candidatus Eisenbacteria bacterium]
MRLRGVALAFLLLAAAGCGPRDVQTAQGLVGDWKGHVAWRDATTPLVLHVRAEGDSLVATMDAPALHVTGQPVGRVSFDSPRVRFVVADSAGTITFDGWRRRNLIVGAWSGGPVAGVTNRALLPQLSLQLVVPPVHKSPWPEGVVGGEPPIVPANERSLAEWIAAR